jgi:malonyl-CoA decarboxylase
MRFRAAVLTALATDSKQSEMTPSGADAMTTAGMSEPAKRPFLTRLLSPWAHSSSPEPVARARARHAIALCNALLSERGDVSGSRLALDLQAAYKGLDEPALGVFFDLLGDHFSPDSGQVRLAVDAYRAEASPTTLAALQAAVEPPRQELFRRCNLAPGGTAFLVDLRTRLLRTLQEHPARAAVDADLAHLFRSWFNRGFLVLQRVDWHTSAVILERLIKHEAVHQIEGWDDLRRRLQADRRCYAFFHPALPDEPLIFIEVALTRGMSATIQPLLDVGSPVADPNRADAAIFYSITNCQEGLQGVSFGHFLIKQVVEDLGREFPRLRSFASLSPVPGFCHWLLNGVRRDGLSPTLRHVLDALRQESADTSVPLELKTELLQLCADYLLHAKTGKKPLDPVARFHLANGARLQRINWMADTAPLGIRRSLGLMVNYVYRLRDVEGNHEAYAKRYEIRASRTLERFARERSLAGPTEVARR